jgi:hypothetical protein
MSQTTYFVATGIHKTDSGDFVAVDAVETISSDKAKSAAEKLAADHDGAVAFYRTGNPATGEFDDAVELARFGELPDDLTKVFS